MEQVSDQICEVLSILLFCSTKKLQNPGKGFSIISKGHFYLSFYFLTIVIAITDLHSWLSHLNLWFLESSRAILGSPLAANGLQATIKESRL